MNTRYTTCHLCGFDRKPSTYPSQCPGCIRETEEVYVERQMARCKTCGTPEAISAFGGRCNVCEKNKEEEWCQDFKNLYEQEPTQAIKELAREIYRLRNKK